MEQRLQESLGPDLGETRQQVDVDVSGKREAADAPKIAEVVQVHREMSHGHGRLEAMQNMVERMKTGEIILMIVRRTTMIQWEKNLNRSLNSQPHPLRRREFHLLMF